jgi:hypothetical protein
MDKGVFKTVLKILALIEIDGWYPWEEAIGYHGLSEGLDGQLNAW